MVLYILSPRYAPAHDGQSDSAQKYKLASILARKHETVGPLIKNSVLSKKSTTDHQAVLTRAEANAREQTNKQ